ncbi:ELWxxDGT repeat protein [Dyadobacter sp. NIV53]|uniref:ELWxxDGT repeat protein n=1 Tax=Dyadobacter sp. NIV53 TaxID=2861765 RepID=UPI001C8727A6|nr:ELWxxDGT repeat protein [Dyadobacter sp. NIV53]
MPSDYVREEAVANNLLFILAGEGSNGLQLWRSDGTDEGTFRLADNYQIQASNPTYLTSAGTFVCFRMIYQNDNWLFRSDGTNEGTYPLHKLSNSGSTFWGIGNINGTMFFSGAQDAGGRQLWKTDGTIAGTQLVKDFGISNKGETGPEQFFNFNGKLSFVIHNEEEIDVDAVLWQSDGTEAGTVPGPALSDGFIQPAVMGNYVYFPEGSSLKRSDGKTITTVKDGFIWLRQPFVVGQSIYFSANHAGSGEELWKSDGTAEGTALVKDIVSGAEDSDPTGFTDVAGTLFSKRSRQATGGCGKVMAVPREQSR